LLTALFPPTILALDKPFLMRVFSMCFFMGVFTIQAGRWPVFFGKKRHRGAWSNTAPLAGKTL
jgi:hypothetical protein